MKITPLGHALSLLFAISFVLCILWGLAMPMSLHMHTAWQQMLPGFHMGSAVGILIGLVEAYLYGWYIAVIFVPLYNFFSRQKAG